MKLKPLFTHLVVVLGLFSSLALNASNTKLPFGIRDYDIGRAQNFILNDVDGEKTELNRLQGQWVFLPFWFNGFGGIFEEVC